MVKLFDEFNKLTSYDQEEINISSFFIVHPISSDFIPTAFNHRPVRHVHRYPVSTSIIGRTSIYRYQLYNKK